MTKWVQLTTPNGPCYINPDEVTYISEVKYYSNKINERWVGLKGVKDLIRILDEPGNLEKCGLR